VTLIHDIEYLIYSDRPDQIVSADKHAIEQASFSLHGLSIKLGLKLRQWFDLDFATTNIPTRVGLLLRDFVMQDPVWMSTLKLYNVEFGRYSEGGQLGPIT